MIGLHFPSVLWRCWLGGSKGIWPVKNWVMEYWRGCLSGVRCRLAADASWLALMLQPLTVSRFSKIQIGFTFLVPAYPGSPGKRAVKRVCVWQVSINKNLNRRQNLYHILHQQIQKINILTTKTINHRISRLKSCLCCFIYLLTETTLWVEKNKDTIVMSITSPNVYRFSKFLHC